ncbi:M6 family metalloprotease domain-containing protein [Priestia megaterium]|uniref:M6 family metalloprotease domain-containing protein n=1 Tax=Priestia megaterium TaxID=1404 RepID=UPI001375207B|nr:M6 family metalloprotease domain-containing protein [Priestia megaterium]
MSAIFGEIGTLPHGNEEVKLRIFGDEFYARYETLDGYTAVYDVDLGKYCYASLENGLFKSTGEDITGPPPIGISPHLEESVIRRNFTNRRNEIPTNIVIEPNRVFGPNEGLLKGTPITKGEVKGLTILVEFSDVSTPITLNDVDEMLNGENYKVNGNHCSVREYFEIVSNKALIYRNHVVGPIKLSREREYYIDELFIKEAMDIVMNELDIDLSDFDSMKRGVVDAVNFFYAGETIWAGSLWPHNFETNMEYNGLKIHSYMLTSLGIDASSLSIGTFCHESGHLLCRFPDMYDYGERDNDNDKSHGIGIYCLMGSGNHLNGGLTPSPVCMYLRNLAKWCSNQIILNNGVYTAKHGDYKTVMKYKTDKDNEYFLIENRTALGLDKYLPSSGLAIYHCDIFGSNEYEEGTPARHYQCALLQADGNLDLERNINPGDAGDLFGEVAGIVLSGNTNPSTKQWNQKESGLIISDVTKPGMNIEFKVKSAL